MAISSEKIREYTQRLLLSRMRILCHHGFYGLLLMHMKFAVDEQVSTACTDGVQIIFGTAFLESLSDEELDFVMMHEILHVVLQHCMRGHTLDNETFNIACDIVVNSNIFLENNKNINSITLKNYGVSMHQTPTGREGYNYTAEEVYTMLKPIQKSRQTVKANRASGEYSQWDDHSRWEDCADVETLQDIWRQRVIDACETISIQEGSKGRGTIPLFAKRLLNELKRAQTDWRLILNDFIQEEIVDYSFSPPDRRFADSPFLLPDFNEKDDVVENILFMIDTSGSMSDKMITSAYSEIKGAIEQFNGKLKGWLGFFDAAIVEPKPFESEEEFSVIRPEGGGGTDFEIIFEYVRQHMQDDLPASIVLLTDGYAPFPEEHKSLGIPVLWLLNNQEVEPPWGKVARIEV